MFLVVPGLVLKYLFDYYMCYTMHCIRNKYLFLKICFFNSSLLKTILSGLLFYDDERIVYL
jgi:hypothetical protein